MQIVVEALSELPHPAIKFLLAGMRERRMPDVMGECERLGELLIEVEHSGDRPGDLRNLDRVCQAIPEMVRQPGGEHLRLVFQPAKGAGMDNAVTVPLKLVAVGVWRLGIPAPAGLSKRESQPAEAQFHFLLLRQFSENRKGNAAD